MTELLMPRRKFLSGLFGLIAAPAIVKAANIMPVKYIPQHLHELDGIGLTTITHPVRTGGVNLAQMRELLMPGLRQMVDVMYEDRSEQWADIFRSS